MSSPLTSGLGFKPHRLNRVASALKLHRAATATRWGAFGPAKTLPHDAPPSPTSLLDVAPSELRHGGSDPAGSPDDGLKAENDALGGPALAAAAAAYERATLTSTLMKKEAYLGRTKAELLRERLRTSRREMAILQVEIRGLEDSIATTHARLRVDRATSRALSQQQVSLEKEAVAPDLRKLRQERLLTKILASDGQQDAKDARRAEEDIQTTERMRERLVATRHSDIVTFDHELASQLRDMTQLTHIWQHVRQLRAQSEAALEDWRLRRIKAEAESTERFRVGKDSAANEATPTMQLIAQALLSKEDRDRSRAKLHTSVCKLHLDQAPLFRDMEKEIDVLERLPHIKRLMTLQMYSQRFTQLGRYINFLDTLLRSTAAMKSLNAAEAMSAIVDVGKQTLQADHVVLYHHEDRLVWPIAPAGLHGLVGETGRGLAGYVAQVQKEIRLNNVATSGIYDPETDDIKISHSDVHSAMVAPIANRQSHSGKSVVKVMRGWGTLANPFNQDDAAIVRVLAVATSQLSSHHQQWERAVKLDALSRAMFATAHELMCCHDVAHVLSCAAHAIARLCTCDCGVFYHFRPDRRSPHFRAYGSTATTRRFERPWQQSLLRRCFKNDAVVVCNQPRSDPGYVGEVDSPCAATKLRNTVFVPVHNSSGGVVGVLQAVNSTPPPASVMRPIHEADGFSEQDVAALQKLAHYAWIALSAAKQFGFCRDHFNRLHGLPVNQGVLQTLRGLQFKLKETLGVESAKVLMVNHDQQQLFVPGPSNVSVASFPLSKGLASRVAKTGHVEVVRAAAGDKAFDKTVDGHDIPPDNIISLPVFWTPREPECSDSAPAAADLPEEALPEVVAVIQATNKRRGFFGADDVTKAAEFSVRASCMLNLSRQLDRCKHHQQLQTSVVNLMYKLAFAKGDPFRRSGVIEDMAISIFNGEAGHYLELSKDGTWVTSQTGNARVRARAAAVAVKVGERLDVVEDVLGSWEARDDYFGTTVKPNVALGAPVNGKLGLIGAIVVQRHSIELYSEWEKQLLRAVCRRISVNKQTCSAAPSGCRH